MDEGALLARARAGDPGAFGSLVRLYQSNVRGFLLRLTGSNHALADDLAQETFLEAFRKLAQFRGEGSLAGWLFSIAHSRFLMEMRRRKMDQPSPDLEAVADAPDQAARLDLESAMARLAAGERAALTLCYAMGFSNGEAARILQMPEGTVKSHILRGREKLRVLLKAWSSEAKT